jgi:CHAT domain-containing protein
MMSRLLKSALLALSLFGMTPFSSAAATISDFSLGRNEEDQSCRASERFDTVRGERAVDVYCGAWERPSGRVRILPLSKEAEALATGSQDCLGTTIALQSSDFATLSQITCTRAANGGRTGPRRYGLIARTRDRLIVGFAFPSDWKPMIEAAKILSGISAARPTGPLDTGSTPGLREIQSVYPQGVPGQAADQNYELLRRRGFEYNIGWSFGASEQDFGKLLSMHDLISPEDQTGRTEVLAELALNLSNSRRFSEAEQIFSRATRDARSLQEPLLDLKLFLYRAIDQLNQNHYEKALELIRASETEEARLAASAARLNQQDARTIDQANSPAARNLLINFDDPSPLEREAILSAQGMFVAGVAAHKLHRADAQNYLDRATNRLLEARAPPAWLISAIANEAAAVRLEQGDAAGAVTIAEGGLKEVRMVAPQTRSEGHLLLTQSRALIALGNSDGALASGRSAIDIFAHQLEQPGLPSDLAASQLGLLLKLSDSGSNPGFSEEYFDTLSLIWDGAAAKSAAQLAARMSLRDGGTESRAYQDGQRNYAAALARRSRLALTPEMSRADIQIADKVVLESFEAFKEAEAQLRSKAPAYLELLNPRASAKTLSSHLAPDEAYLRIVLTQAGGFGALVSATGVIPYRITVGRSWIEAQVEKLRRSTRLRGTRLPDYNIAVARALYDALIAPIAGPLTTVKHLQVDAAGPLASLPFAALIASPPTPALFKRIAETQDYRGVDWFGHHLSVAQSLGPAAFMRFRQNLSAQPQTSPRIAAFGNFIPDPEGVAARIVLERGLPDHCRQDIANALAALGALPDTADEVKKVGALFGPSSRTGLGAAFTEANVFATSSSTEADVMLLATHGVLGLSSCFAEPALLTSLGPTGDGLIEASHLLDQKLTARLVVLSACDTAGGGRLDVTRAGLSDGGEALSGLARGFIYAGASGVMATQWKIDSASSAALINDFLTNASGEGMNIADSLARAQAKAYANPDTAHPFYWAGFVLIGDGATSISKRSPATSVPKS